MNDVNLTKFPSIIRKVEGFKFPANTEFKYDPIIAYRGVKRDDENFYDVTIEDFRSYAELGIKNRNIDTNSPDYYAASLYKNKTQVENALKFPRKTWYIAKGNVYCEGGPRRIKEATGHIDWWLYEGVSINNFIIMRKNEE